MDGEERAFSGSGFHRNQTQAGGLGWKRKPFGLKTKPPVCDGVRFHPPITLLVAKRKKGSA